MPGSYQAYQVFVRSLNPEGVCPAQCPKVTYNVKYWKHEATLDVCVSTCVAHGDSYSYGNLGMCACILKPQLGQHAFQEAKNKPSGRLTQLRLHNRPHMQFLMHYVTVCTYPHALHSLPYPHCITYTTPTLSLHLSAQPMRAYYITTYNAMWNCILYIFSVICIFTKTVGHESEMSGNTL